MKQLEASYTVEMALLLPVVLFALLGPVIMGYEMYQQTKNASICGWNEEFCPEEKVRLVRVSGDIWEELK